MEIFEFTLNKGDADYNRELYMAKSNAKKHLVQYAILYLQNIVEPMNDLDIKEAGLTRKKVNTFKEFLRWIISKRVDTKLPKFKFIKARYNKVSPDVKNFFTDFDEEMKAVEKTLRL